MFLIPTITFFVTGILFFLLQKKTSYKQIFKQYIFRVIIISFLLNFTWELFQLPLYKNSDYNFNHIAFCGLATVADVIMVLLLYLSFAFILKDLFWVLHMRLQRTILVIFIGGTGAILSEMRHLSLGSWGYDNSMPLIPFVNVGISPVLQFMFLPLVIYKLGFYFSKNKIIDFYNITE